MAAIFYQPSNSRSRIFAKEAKGKAISFLIATAFSFVSMFADYHYHYLNTVRGGFTFLISPLQYAVDYPVSLIGSLQSLVTAKKALVDENITLRYHQTLLEAELQKLRILKEENSELKELLLTSSKANMRAMAAQILAVDTTHSRQLMVLNKGKRDDVYVGQPVLDAKGVIGQVIDVGSLSSTVLLISDAKSAVPVRNHQTGERAILVGKNNMDQLSLINLPKTSPIKKGDLLVTSGLGRLYPEGYPVGRVTSIQHIPGEAFIKIDVLPAALLNRARLVLLIWPEKEQIALTEQVKERLIKMGSMV